MQVDLTDVDLLDLEDPLEEGMATHSNILAWRIPWREESGGQQSMGSQSWTQLKRLSTHAHTFSQLDVTDRVPATVKLTLQFSILHSLERLNYNIKSTFQCNWILQEKSTQGN